MPNYGLLQNMGSLDFSAQSKIISSINRHLFLILAMLAGVFVVSQFLILATVGTKGAEITAIRHEKEELRIDNEALRSDTDKVKTLAEIEGDVEELFELVPASVETLQAAGYADPPVVGEAL